MPLSKENMETTGDRLDHSKIWRDVARMDEDQLGRYVGMAFQGDQDFSFLPHTFWTHYFDINSQGNDGRMRPSPASFFAEIYVIIGKVKEGTYRVNGEAPDEMFRSRFETVINTITSELISQKEEPTEKHFILVSSIAETVGRIRFNEDPDIVEEKFGGVQGLRKDPRYTKVRFPFWPTK